ncbi:MAG: pyrroloquinoline quinone biosynthesis protein PqqB [Gammaproteobacteria bacterium]|jgi:pyrroloquinoline quinone biosynthesis protein B|nr:pyrroloquinoline quinone biosynthesis protein PqqB [Gammaproteobacteria bacterium]
MFRFVILLLFFLPSLTLAETEVYLQVLGIAQDAGYPQANCYQPHCMRAWENPELRRLSSSIAVVDTKAMNKYLFEATPDIREQLYQLSKAAPDSEYRLDGVFLTHAHIGHYTGLMHFGHEASGSSDMPVYAMPRMLDFLSKNGPWDQLVRFKNIRLMPLGDGAPVTLSSRLSVTPILVPHRDEYSETVGYRIEGPKKTAIFIPDIDKWDRWDTSIRTVVRTADYALIDATFFADGELPGRDMSKILHPFVSESMELLEDLTEEEKARVIFIHMNHTNPLLIDGSPAQMEVEARGFRFAHEGLKLEL